MSDKLTPLLQALGLEAYGDQLARLARPSIEVLTADVPLTACCSRLGGDPELPSGFEWPSHTHGLYRFIGQINLSDLPDAPHGMPSAGLLSLFYAHDDDGESFWGDPDFVRVYHFERLEGLRLVETPEPVRLGSMLTVRFQLGVDVPPWPWKESDRKAWPIAESHRDAYSELRRRLHPSRRYLLGYPFNTTLAYDPTPGPEWVSLLTLSSDDELEWCWHDGDWLVTFIERDRLRIGDFSIISSDAG